MWVVVPVVRQTTTSRNERGCLLCQVTEMPIVFNMLVSYGEL